MAHGAFVFDKSSVQILPNALNLFVSICNTTEKKSIENIQSNIYKFHIRCMFELHSNYLVIAR